MSRYELTPEKEAFARAVARIGAEEREIYEREKAERQKRADAVANAAKRKIQEELKRKTTLLEIDFAERRIAMQDRRIAMYGRLLKQCSKND